MIIAIAVTMSVAANAQDEQVQAKHQQGDMSFGGHIIHYMEDGISLTGIGAKFRYTVIEQLRVEAGLSYFFPKEIARIMGISANVSMLDFSVNAHYLFPINERLTLYPLVGLGLLNLRATATADVLDTRVSTSESHVIINIGGGAEFQVADNISFHLEPRLLRIVDNNNNRGGFTISAGVMFSF